MLAAITYTIFVFNSATIYFFFCLHMYGYILREKPKAYQAVGYILVYMYDIRGFYIHVYIRNGFEMDF